MKPTLPFVAVLGAVLVLGAGAGVAAYAALSNDGTKTVVRQITVSNGQPAASGPGLSVGAIYRRAHKGVVEITVSSQFGQQSQGSGFVYDASGDIITNEHVAAGASSISVRFSNGASYDARLVGSDPSTDLAVIKVDAPRSVVSPLTLGDSGGLSVGDSVVAIGSPFGLEETVTSGIVSALHRQMSSPNGFAINDSIQTDAAINHGNSGGPLLNTQGRVVGVNAQIKSDSGGNEGVGFAIPSNTVRSVVSQILATGKVEHAYLGVRIDTTAQGVRIGAVVPGMPAAAAGLRSGDVITEIAGRKVTSAQGLQVAIAAKHPGDTISVTYTRAGQSHTVQVKLANRPLQLP
ncbi:MAG TPA: trypsin-like peptidase domain-containing protein [Gaiellaceae bacterium]